MRSSGGNKRRRTRELCCLRQQNLLTIAIVSLAVLLCLQVCLFLPLVLELPHVNGSPADNQLLAVSNGGNGSTEVEEDAWSEFHALPKVCLLACGHAYVRPT